MLKLIAVKTLTHTDISHELSLDKNRKKSENMVFAIKITESLLLDLPQEIKSKFNLILTTGDGEIAQTYDFLKNLAENRLRPTLFMNSLHNSTLGALSLEVPGIVSGMTISNGELSFEYGLEAAFSFLDDLPIIILGIDAYNPEMQRVREELSVHTIKFQSGAVAGLFLPEKHPSYNQYEGIVIKDLKYTNTTTTTNFTDTFYPANGLSLISQNIFEYQKPNGTQVQVITHV